ncbi:MAG: glycosyltransferase family 2 protein [Acidobacteriota bacterium]|nr:glycosyltransferase family 2 protein [Acidobacteriota bacterium]
MAVVIPCRNEAQSICALLDALLTQGRRPDETVVVDDASTDGTAGVIGKWASANADLPITVVTGSGRGAGAAMNTGITAARASVVVRLDGHCRPARNYIEQCLLTLGNQPNVGVVGGVWQIEPGATTTAAHGIAAVLSHPMGSGGAAYRRAGDPRKSQEPSTVDTVPFGAFRRSLWESVGGFDESLLRNQDYDFNHRVRLRGLDVVLNPAIVSVYRARPTLSALARQYFGYGFWKVVMLRKFPASLRLRQLLPLLLAPGLAALAVWAGLTHALVPVLLLSAYFSLDLIGAAQAAGRAGDLRLIPFGAAALVTLQTAWSAGAWASLLKGLAATAGPLHRQPGRSGKLY